MENQTFIEKNYFLNSDNGNFSILHKSIKFITWDALDPYIIVSY